MRGDSRRRQWWLAACAAAAIGTAFAALATSPAEPLEPLPRAPSPSLDSTLPATSVDERTAATSLAAGTRDAADVPDATAGMVVIVDELDRAVPGADVAWQRVASADWHAEPLREREHEVRAAGVQVLADARGRVVVPDARHARVVARHGDRYGQGVVHFEAHEGPQLVRIGRDVTVRLVAIDGAGTPQPGVPIELAYRDAPDDRYLPWRTGRLAGITGSDGRLVVGAVQTLPHWPRAAPTIALRAIVFGAESEYVEVGLAAAAPEEIRVPCPPFGRARLQVVGPDGFAVRTVPDPIRLGPSSGGHRTFERYFATRTAPSEVVLGPLTLGGHWELREPFANGFAGPKQPGETVIVRAQLREPQRSLLVLAPDGRPLRNTRVQCGQNANRWREGRTDVEGWLATEWGFDDWVFSDELLAGAPTEGVGDGGSIVLSPLLRTSLVCVDASSGELVAAYADQQRDANPDVSVFFAHGRSRLQVDVLSDRGGILHLTVVAEGYQRTTVDVTAGSTDVVVPLQSDGTFTLAVRLLVDEDLPASGFELRIVRGSPLTDTPRTRRVGSDAIEASWGGLPDAPHRVEVRLTEGVGLVRVVENLRPSRDGATAAVIDLRGIAAVATFAEVRGSLRVTNGSGWGDFGSTERPLLLPKDACWHGFLEGWGLPVLFPIRPGRNQTTFAPYPTLRLACPGAGTTFDPEGISVGVWVLRRQEPLLDAFEAACRTPDDEPSSPPSDFASLTLDQLAKLPEVGFRFSLVDPAEGAHYECHVRGVYLVVPRLDDVPLLDQAMEVAIDGTVTDVVATLTIDPLRLAAARRAQAEVKDRSEGR